MPTDPGTYDFTARVTDSVSNTVTKALAITVVSPTLTIATAELPGSIVGATYSATLTASGGMTPYIWSIVWGALPDGLNLNSAGLVSGTPTNGGTFSFIVQVADHASATATEIFTVAIQDNAPSISVQGYTNGAITLLISGDAGPDYTFECSTNLVDWQDTFTTNPPAIPFSWTDTSGSNSPMRFYRVRLER
jgi:hypothetical protein